MNQNDFVIADPHVVYYDAVLSSPWTQSDHPQLPGRGDWSTYRCASKDIIVGVVTHRYNRQNRRLEIRAYFIGEHPIFRDLEPTRVMLIILCSQAYQSGGSMELFFEQGIPFDVRQLIERHAGEQLSGHQQVVPENLARRLYAILSDFSLDMCDRIESEVPVELVCFNTYRGTWTSNHIKSLIQRGVSLTWIFMNRPDPLQQPARYAHLINHLRGVMIEEYALHRLADRKLGVSAGKRISRIDENGETWYFSEYALQIPGEDSQNQLESDSFVKLTPHERFCLIPVVAHSSQSIIYNLECDIERANQFATTGKSIIVVPLDFIYLADDVRNKYKMATRAAGHFLLIVGLTMAQLLTEAEFNLAITAAQADEGEVEDINAIRYAD